MKKEEFKSMTILVIGDSGEDVFQYGTITRLCPEAPVPVFNPTIKTSNPGMSGNVVANLKALGAEIDFITNKTEIRKIRYVCSKYNYLLLRVDENDKCEPIDASFLPEQKYDAIVISDYCKGFLSEDDIEFIVQNASSPIFLDTKKILGDWAYNIDFIKINYHEYERNKEILENDLILKNKTIITRGKYGCDYQGKNYPTVDVSVKDVSGAGDTFLAGLVVEYVRSQNIEKAIQFAQDCTTVVVQKSGVSTI
jgi:D-beta-D-heptose 7-phosphate kinase/D-beta-D-heptose 1-phosphate adenosyltransferase